MQNAEFANSTQTRHVPISIYNKYKTSDYTRTH